MSSKTAKKALGEGIDSQIAEMKTNEIDRPRAKAKAKGKAKATPKAKNKETSDNKKMQKEIKGFLVSIQMRNFPLF